MITITKTFIMIGVIIMLTFSASGAARLEKEHPKREVNGILADKHGLTPSQIRKIRAAKK